MRTIRKVINGRPVVFATIGGGQGKGIPVLVFETEDDYNAAAAAGEVPDPSLIVTLDDLENGSGGV